ncbi:hypothetical protein FQZ97_948060 [compost metagenome]
MDFCFHLFALGEVVDQTHESGDAAALVPQGGDGQIRRYAGPVLAGDGPFPFLGQAVARAGRERLESRRDRLAQFRGQDPGVLRHLSCIVPKRRRLLAGDLVSGVPQQALGRRVEAGDDSLGRDRDDAVGRVGQNGALEGSQSAQVVFPLLDAFKHGVEALPEAGQLAGARDRDAVRVIRPGANQFGRFGQRSDGAHDRSPQHRHLDQRGGQQNEHASAKNPHGLMRLRAELRQAHVDTQAPAFRQTLQQLRGIGAKVDAVRLL